jgi:hypothetical protein
MHVWLDGTRDGFVVLPLLSVVPVMIVVAGDKRKASANRASDQGAEGSSEQTPRHTTTRGLVSRCSRPERRASAEADQSSEWRERGWTRRGKCRGISSSPRRWHGPARRSWERGSLSDDFIFA